MMRLLSAWRFVGILAPLALLLLANAAIAQTGTPPNLILILADDQQWAAIDSMPKLQTYFAQQGVKFTNAFSTTALCCPSRASILTGQYAHNHGVLDNTAPDGGFTAFTDTSTIATWLKTAGYRTGLFGKYLNGYLGPNNTYVPPGWDDWRGILTEDVYYDYNLNENGVTNHYGSEESDYLTDVLANKAANFIRAGNGSPFFVYLAPSAPHRVAVPAIRHLGLFLNLPPWRPPSYNEADVSDKPAWVQGVPRLSSSTRQFIDDSRQDELRALQAVDDAIDSIITAVNDIGATQNTIIIYAGDNGFMWGEHRLDNKGCAFEEPIRIPMLVRAPGIVNSPRVENRLVLNIDLASTFAEYAGATPTIPVDGNSLVSLVDGTASSWRTDFLVENWDLLRVDGIFVPEHDGVRNDNWKYIEYDNGEKELYDLVNDPYELTSHANDPGYSAIQAQLATRLQELRNYRGCTSAPAAAFAGSPLSGNAPLTVSFTDQSTGFPSAWLWDFGDGGASTAQNPSHQYATPGTYTVSLAVSNACGNDSEQKLNYVVVQSAPSNLALNKPAAASTTSGSNTPGKAVDGSTSTYWRSGSVSSNTTVWWRVNLTASYTINRVVIKWRGAYYAQSYQIQVSSDGEIFTAVYTDNAGNGGTDEVTFAATVARYVRIYMTKNNSSSERINEVEVYASSSAALGDPSDSQANSAVIPNEISLAQNHPNPFNPTTRIRYQIPHDMNVSLKVYNMLGEEVRTLVEGYHVAGSFEVEWDGRQNSGTPAPSGVYIYRLQGEGFTEVRKMILLQ